LGISNNKRDTFNEHDTCTEHAIFIEHNALKAVECAASFTR
jgi:hypothetical protein